MNGISDKTLNLLANQPLFRALERNELLRLARGTSERRVNRGEVIFQAGEPAVGFFVLVYGQVKLAMTSPQGQEKVVETFAPGASFGEALMFLDRPYFVYSQALEDSLVLFISKEAIFTAIDEDPTLARRMLAGLSLRLHGLIRDIEALSLQSALQRVTGYLLNQPSDPTPDGERIYLRMNKNLIASRLNLTPETLSRVLHQLSEDGLMQVQGKEILVSDMAALRQSVFEA